MIAKVVDYALGAFTGAMFLGSVGALITVAAGPDMNGGPEEYRFSIWFGAVFCGLFGAGLGALARYVVASWEKSR